jgi:hypothetical protein
MQYCFDAEMRLQSCQTFAFHSILLRAKWKILTNLDNVWGLHHYSFLIDALRMIFNRGSADQNHHQWGPFESW